MKQTTIRIIKTIKHILIATILILILFCIVFIASGAMELGVINTRIKVFKARSSYECEKTINGITTGIYKVIGKEDELVNFSKVLDVNTVSDTKIIGSNCDIFITNRNPLASIKSAFVKDAVGMLADIVYIGHTNMIIDDGASVIESVGLDEENGVRIKENTWLDEMIRLGSSRENLIGVRIKNLKEDDRNIILNDIKGKVGLGYNYNFLFSFKNKYYCTDLITECVKKINIRLNYDGLFKTGSDILVSNNVFIIFVLERVKEDKFNIYYLDME